MNREKKLKELERRQREIADEIKQLREEPERKEPEVGDVYLTERGGCVLIIGRDGKKGWVRISPRGNEIGYLTGIHEASISFIIKSNGATYLGKFDDVFITKKRVAEIIANTKDWDGSTAFKRSLMFTSNLRKALADEGITAELAGGEA